jgi:hypothetical protein
MAVRLRDLVEYPPGVDRDGVRVAAARISPRTIAQACP